MSSHSASNQRSASTRKRQSENQLVGRRGELVASFCFPDEWVVRPLPHDFGLDREVEPFYEVESDDRGRARFETRGEHLYVQVKTVDAVSFAKPSVSGLPAAPAHRLTIDTSELKLAEEMGASVPILLLLVHRSSGSIYFVCLTDYVAKVIDITSPEWRSQKTASIWIPERNRLTGGEPSDVKDEHLDYFLQLARRGQYFSVFNFLWRAKAEIDNAFTFVDFAEPRAEYFRLVTASFHAAVTVEIPQLLRLDVWGRPGNLPVVRMAHDTLRQVQAEYIFTDESLSAERLRALTQQELHEFVENYRSSASTVAGLFDMAAKTGSTFEEVSRHAYLPTDLSAII